jgi:hypothetical protein
MHTMVIETTWRLVETIEKCLISRMQHDSTEAVSRLRSELTMFRGLWPGYEADLLRMGIFTVAELRGRDPDRLAAEYCRVMERPEDPLLSACFAAVVRFAETGERVPYWRIMRDQAMREGEAVAIAAD